MKSNILAIRIDHRSRKADGVQKVLTKHGDIIKLRIGCHETFPNKSHEDGLIILHLDADSETETDSLRNELESIDNLTIRTMSI